MRMITPRLLAAIVFLTVCESGSSMSAKPIDELLSAAVNSGRVAGVVAMAADADRVLYAGAFGLANVAAETPMEVDTVFRVASMTKPITSVAIMQLMEAGKLKLDSPVGNYLPELPDKLKLIRVEGSQGVFEKPAAQPTVAQLLTHTSGLGYEIWSDVLNRGAQAGLFPGMTTSSGQDYLAAPLVFEPGTQWLYSISTDVLGHLVESIEGLSLEDYFQQSILQPLGMNETSFLVPESRRGRVATLHARTQGLSLAEQENDEFPPPEAFSGGGGLFSTAPDYVRFMQMILRDGRLEKRILQPQSVQEMASNQIGDMEMSAMPSQWPGLSNDFHLFPESTGRFGYGFAINDAHLPGRRGAGSLAWAGLYNTYFWIDRSNNRCGVILTQILPFFDAEVVDLLKEFEQAVYQNSPQSR